MTNRIATLPLALTLTLLALSAVAYAQADELPPPEQQQKASNEPVRLSIDLNDVPFADALKRMSMETGVSLQFTNMGRHPEPDAMKDVRITFKADNQPVQAVIADFLRAAKCSVSLQRDYGTMMLVKGESLATIALDDRITLLVQSIQTEGYANVRAEEGPTRYMHTITCVAICNPSLRAIAAVQMAVVDELKLSVPELPQQFGWSSDLGQIDGRRVPVMFTTIRFATSEHVDTVDKIAASWRVLVATDEAKVAIEAADFMNGGDSGDDQLKISVPPPQQQDDNRRNAGFSFNLQGKLLERYKGYPWESVWQTGAIRIDGIDGGPLSNVYVNSQGYRDGKLGFRLFQRMGGQRNWAEEIDRIQVVLPTKAKFITVPIVLTDLKMP